MHPKHLLETTQKNFLSNTGYDVVVGVEQEFYVTDPSPEGLDSLRTALAKFPFFGELEEEKGKNQFEVQIFPTDNPVVMGDMVMMLRDVINTTPNLQTIFAAKPFPHLPGSGMHIHINLVDKSGHNAFIKDGEDENPLMQQVIAGLLELMPASTQYFAPYEEAYARYREHGMESPSTISWGGDNRTASLRIPSVPLTPSARRIEHRVPCADADPYLCLAAILKGAEYGIVNKLENKHPKIFGNAFLPQYNLPKLPQGLDEARNGLQVLA